MISTTVLVAFLSLQATTTQPSATTSPPVNEAAAPEDIVVSGERERWGPLARPQAPYSETLRTPLGSRIARRVSERPFRTVATESGVAGMLHGNGIDGTGGTFASPVGRNVTECVAEDRQVRAEIACVLFRVSRNTQLGELEVAQTALAPLLVRRGLNEAETYAVGHVAFRLAQANEDAALKAQALRLLIASNRLGEPERTLAEHSLASLASGGR